MLLQHHLTAKDVGIEPPGERDLAHGQEVSEDQPPAPGPASLRGHHAALLHCVNQPRPPAFTDGHDVPVGASLRLPLALVSPVVDPASRVIFFAVVPGAFTDLAADLSYALGASQLTRPSGDARDGSERDTW
jgi:hypothetical protein